MSRPAREALRPADLDALAIGVRPDGVRVTVQVKPRASRTGVLGVKDGALVIAVAAPPVEGQANDALVRVLAEVLGVPSRSVAIATGQGSKRKMVDVTGLTATALRARLAQ